MQWEASSHGRMYYLGPPLFGAVALFAIVGVGLLAKLPNIVRNSALLLPSLAALASATGAGCLAGVAYVVLGRPARRVHIIGPYLAGVITIAAYMGALLLASPFFSAEPLVKGRSDLMLFAGITVFFGLFAGHSWFRERVAPTQRDDPPTV